MDYGSVVVHVFYARGSRLLSLGKAFRGDAPQLDVKLSLIIFVHILIFSHNIAMRRRQHGHKPTRPFARLPTHLVYRH